MKNRFLTISIVILSINACSQNNNNFDEFLDSKTVCTMINLKTFKKVFGIKQEIKEHKMPNISFYAEKPVSPQNCLYDWDAETISGSGSFSFELSKNKNSKSMYPQRLTSSELTDSIESSNNLIIQEYKEEEPRSIPSRIYENEKILTANNNFKVIENIGDMSWLISYDSQNKEAEKYEIWINGSLDYYPDESDSYILSIVTGQYKLRFEFESHSFRINLKNKLEDLIPKFARALLDDLGA